VIAYFRFALVAMLLAGIACLSAIITMQFAVHRTIVTVPELQGESVAEATSRAARMGLDVSVSQRFYSAVLPAGRVLMQSPAPGTSVRRGWDLAVAESLGPQRVTIPDVQGKDERDAILLIRQKGLELGAIAQLPDAQVKAGTVLAQDPGPHAKGASRPSVSLLVASPDPPPPAAFVMPDVVGQPYAAVAAVLTGRGRGGRAAWGRSQADGCNSARNDRGADAAVRGAGGFFSEDRAVDCGSAAGRAVCGYALSTRAAYIQTA
jgi:beta-lactam-binding protein with PASTA domain